MKSELQFDFIADKENHSITIKREFAAGKKLVWQAYTDSEILDQWWAPKPWTAKTKSMDFREGGHWLYAMVSPEGDEHLGRLDYKKIVPKDSYVGLDAFCHPDGTINTAMPRANWKANFDEMGDHTLVTNIIKYDSLDQLEMIIKMGMKEGITIAMESLDELLSTLSK
ncbi:MAG: SRPBCC domain-containing protein [Cyclobacteriaceae bacterium]